MNHSPLVFLALLLLLLLPLSLLLPIRCLMMQVHLVQEDVTE